ncbi:MAG: hypothetical protein ACLR0N_14800 [Bilophila wadsworthia]
MSEQRPVAIVTGRQATLVWPCATLCGDAYGHHGRHSRSDTAGGVPALCRRRAGQRRRV